MFDGVWRVTGGRLGDQSIDLPASELRITGATYVVETSVSRDEGRWEVQPDSEPLAVDLIGTDGPHSGKRLRAIARVRGDTLQLVYGAGENAPRPSDFVARGGAPVLAVRYRRVT
jgi:uncharacterized protein (TIGR03067 family)